MKSEGFSYDLGFIAPPVGTRGFKVTVSEFGTSIKVHTREYYQDGDTGEWFPTKNGISIGEEHVDTWKNLLDEASDLVAHIWKQRVNNLIDEGKTQNEDAPE